MSATQDTEQSGLSPCCLSGKLQTGTPSGHIEKIDGRETYIAASTHGNKEKTIVFISDIFGYKLPNSQLLADEIAKAGFQVLLPDVFDDGAMDIESLKHIEPPLKDVPNLTVVEKLHNQTVQTTQLMPFAIKHREAVAKPKIDAFISHLRTDPSIKRIGVVGFCWGGRHAILQAQEGSVVDVVVACHPSTTTVADYETIVKPISLAYGAEDTLVPISLVHQVMDVLGKKTELLKEIRIYEEQVHGFALRGDFSSDRDKKAMDEAHQQIIEFFKQHL